MSKFVVDFIGIGSWKCGTSWVAYILRQHPEVWVSRKKEIHFFNDKKINGRKNYSYEKGMKFYRSFWPKKIPKGVIVGEFSPTYLPDKLAAKRIRNTFPNVKILVMLRNPMDKAYSVYRSRRNFAVDVSPDITFREFVYKYKEYIEDCLYYPQLKRYYDLFPRSQIGVFLLEDVKKDSLKASQSIFKFLEVDDKFQPETSPQNPTPQYVAGKFSNMISKLVNIPIVFFRTIESIFPKNFRENITRSKLVDYYSHFRRGAIFSSMKKDNKKSISEDTKEYLKKYFSKDIKKLEKLTSLDLSIWK